MAEGAQQLCLVILSAVHEDLLHLVECHLYLPEGQVTAYDFLHLAFEPFNLLVSDVVDGRPPVFLVLALVYLAVESARKRVVYAEDLVRIEFLHGIAQHEAQRPDVCPAPVRVVVPYEAYGVRHHDLELKLFQPVVHKCGEHRQFCAGLVIVDAPGRHV